MSYPQINYLGAAQGMVGILENAERMKLAEQESLRRQEESQSLAKYRDMQMSKMQAEEDRERKLNQVMTQQAQEESGPDFRPSLAQRAVMDSNPPLGGAAEAYPQGRVESYEVPAKRRFGEGLTGRLAQAGLGKEAYSYMAKVQEKEAAEKKDEMEVWNKRIIEAIKAKDNNALDFLIKAGAENPKIGKEIAPLKGLKVTPEGMEVNFTQTIPAGGKNPLSGEVYDKPTKLDIKQVTRPDGTTEFKQAKEIDIKEDDTDFKLFVKAKKSLGWDENRISTEWEKIKDKRSESSGLTAMAREQAADRAEREVDRKDQKDKQDRIDAGAKAEIITSKMLNDDDSWMGRKGQSELKPESLRAINSGRTAAGLPPLKKVPITGRTEPGKIYGTNPLPDKITYVPDEKAAPVLPPRPTLPPPGAGLSGQIPVRPPVAPPMAPPVRPPVRPPAPMVSPQGGLTGAASKIPTQGKPITKDKAMEYRKKYGSQEAAMEAARKDGWTGF